MADLPLIRSLQNPPAEEKTPLPRGHKYKEFQVLVDNETVIVNIPEREAEKFETFLEGVDTVNKYDLKQIMRELRGIRG